MRKLRRRRRRGRRRRKRRVDIPMERWVSGTDTMTSSASLPSVKTAHISSNRCVCSDPLQEKG